MAKNSPNLVEDINLQILNAQWTPKQSLIKKLKPGGLFPADFLLGTHRSFSLMLQFLSYYFIFAFTEQIHTFIENTTDSKKHCYFMWRFKIRPVHFKMPLWKTHSDFTDRKI